MRFVRRALLVLFVLLGLLAPATVARGEEPVALPLTEPCPAGEICIKVDTTEVAGAAKLRAQGFLNGISDQTPMELMNALKPQLWRTTDHFPTGGLTQYDRAKATGAKMDYIMMADWLPHRFSTVWTCQPGANQPPGVKPGYVDLIEYDAWLDSFIAEKLGAGKDITYWEPENEPDITGCVYGGRYKHLRYEQFKHAYDKVTAAVPGAKVTAPSIDVFADTHSPIGCRPATAWIDLSSMLDHAKLNNIKYGALAWHEISDFSPACPEVHHTTNPPVIRDHVATVRAMVAARQPEVGNPEILINEYGSATNWMLPGWVTGFIAALEGADVDGAARTCWPDPEQGLAETCYAPSGVVNGLFTTSHQPQAIYWAHRAYADMSCPDATCAVRKTTRVGVASTDERVTGFATRDDVLSKVSLLVGRHVSCTKVVNLSCTQPAEATPAASASTITLGYPYGGSSARVVVQQIPNVRGAVPAMTAVSDTVVDVVGGEVTALVPEFADGESYVVTVEPDPDAEVTAVVPEGTPLVLIFTAGAVTFGLVRRRRHPRRSATTSLLGESCVNGRGFVTAT